MLGQIKIILNILGCSILLVHNNGCTGSEIGGKRYYVSTSGNDENDGSAAHPLKTLAFLNTINLKAGDTVFLKAQEIFDGNLLLDSTKSGIKGKPIIITSYGKGSAIISAGNGSAATINNSSYINIYNLACKGSGRKDGNTKNGVAISNCQNIQIKNVEITGFQKAGLFVYSSNEISIFNIHAYQNGFAGISVEGDYQKKNSGNILIIDCLAENNPGDPTNFNNHSGNGILVGNSKNVTIENCIATNNGWDMPRIGNGPVGIWCYEADSVTIQYCISYKNKTAKGADDGGGFDFDGGVTNSVIQYCLSYENEGGAFGIFQYDGASPWHDNIIRYNISENDGAVSAAHAAAYIWNSSGAEKQFRNLSFYNNILYNEKGAAIHYASGQSKREGFSFHNNIFVGKDEILKGTSAADNFSGNTWWSIGSGFNADSVKDFRTWTLQKGKENNDRSVLGKNENPYFKKVFFTTVQDTYELQLFINSQLSKYKVVKGKRD